MRENRRALRTQTKTNRTKFFRVDKRRHNLPKLREAGFAANRTLREVEEVKHACILAGFDNIDKGTDPPGKASCLILDLCGSRWVDHALAGGK